MRQEPDCSICTLAWPEDPEDPEFMEIRVIYREHLLALGSVQEVTDHVTARALWIHGDSLRATQEAQGAVERWLAATANSEPPDEPEQEELLDPGSVDDLEPNQRKMLDRTIEGYCRTQGGKGKMPDHDILERLEKNFVKAALKSKKRQTQAVQSASIERGRQS